MAFFSTSSEFWLSSSRLLTVMAYGTLLLLLGQARGHQDGHQHFIPEDDKWDSRLSHDLKHIQEDIDEYFKSNFTDVTKLSAKDIEYYYFVLHDFDKNNKLDGLELLAAVMHVLDHSDTPNGRPSFAGLTQAVDDVLRHDDLDIDGFLSYPEFVYAQKRYGEQTGQ